MKTAVSLPDDLFERAERAAEREHCTRSGLYARAIEAYLAELDRAGRPRRRLGLWAGQVSVADGVDLIGSDPDVVGLFDALAGGAA